MSTAPKYKPRTNGVKPICPCKDKNCPYQKGTRDTSGRPARI